MSAGDPLAAVCAYLKASPAGALLEPLEHGPAVFRPTLPQPVQKTMPMACIVVRPAGGYIRYTNGLLPLADPRVDLTCYGAEQQQSYEIAVAATEALQTLQMSVWENVKLLGAAIGSGPIPLPDQATLWPATWLSAQITYVRDRTAGNPES